MMIIKNKIGEKIKEYQEKTGATKAFIARRLGYNSSQALDGVINSKNPTIETLELFSRFLECDIKDLYEIENF